MVFSSLQAYLDPANWQHQLSHQQHHQYVSSSSANTHLLPPPLPPPPPPPSASHGSDGSSSIRPGSLADRARLANIPMPEAALKCPRCESTNTKFCYFNNYSLTQPRHFCKTCRRYWTRGGALRNVPVGGGCRRNKRSKAKNTSKSPASNDRLSGSASSSTISPSSGTSDHILGLGPQLPPLSFMAPSHHELGNCDIGLNYGAFSTPVGGTGDVNFQLGSALASSGLGGAGTGGGGSGSSLLTMGGFEEWRMQQGQQYPLLGGLDSTSSVGLYSYEGGVEPSSYGQFRQKIPTSLTTKFASVKMEDNELNLSRQFSGVNNQGSDQCWIGTTWTDMSSLGSSSTSNPL